MLRVLLLIDDYNELVFLQTMLKKLGFDAEGIQNPRKYPDLKLSLNPHVVIATAKGHQIDGLRLAASETKGGNAGPKFILLRTHEVDLKASDAQQLGAEEVLDSPVNARILLKTLARIGGLDARALDEKYGKMMKRIKEDTSQVMARGVQDNASTRFPIKKVEGELLGSDASDEPEREVAKQPLSAQERRDRFAQHLSQAPPPKQKVFPLDKVNASTKHLRAEELTGDLKSLEDERKEYVKALFVDEDE